MQRCVQRGVVRIVFFIVLCSVDTFQVKNLYPASVHFLSPKTFLARRESVSFKKEYDAILTLFHEINNVSMMLLGTSELYELEEGQKSAELFHLIKKIKKIFFLFKESWPKEVSLNHLIPLRTLFNDLGQELMGVIPEVKNFANSQKKHEAEWGNIQKELLEKIIFLINVHFGYQKMELEEMSLFAYLQNKKIMPPSSIKSNMDFVFDIGSIEGCFVRGNKHALDHAYDNLIRNAQKHGKATQINVRGFVHKKSLTIEIKNDVGKGGRFIEPEWLKPILVSSPESELPMKEQRLFVERFTTSPEDGYRHGLGLKACLDSVKMMGGTIQVKSSPKETVFSIILPLAGSTLPRTGTGSLKIPESHKKRYLDVEASL